MKRNQHTHKRSPRYHSIDDWFPPTTARNAKSITQNKAGRAYRRIQMSSGDIEQKASDQDVKTITQANASDSNQRPLRNGPSFGTPEDYGSETDTEMEDEDEIQVCSSHILCEKKSDYTPFVQSQTSSLKILPCENGTKVRPTTNLSAPQTNENIYLQSTEGGENLSSMTDSDTPDRDSNENYRLVGHFTNKAMKGTDAYNIANFASGRKHKTGVDHESFVPKIISDNANGEELTKYLDRLGTGHELYETHSDHGFGTAIRSAQSSAEPKKSSSSRLSLDDTRQMSSESGSKYLVPSTNSKGHLTSKDRYDGAQLPTSNDRNTSRAAVENKPFVPQKNEFQSELTSDVNPSRKREGQTSEKQRASKTCESCGKFLSCQKDFEEHYLLHFSDRPLICNVCNKTFKRRDLWLAHWYIHTKDPDFGKRDPGDYGPFLPTSGPNFPGKSEDKLELCLTCHFPLSSGRGKNLVEIVDLVYRHNHCPVCHRVYRVFNKLQAHIMDNHMN